MAAAPCPMSVKEAVVEYFGPALYEFYGSSELGREHDPETGGRAAKAGLVRAGRAGHGRSRSSTTTAGPCPRASPASSTSGSSPASSTSTTRTPTRPRGMRRGRLVLGGRRRVHGRRRLLLHLRPQARHDHLGRRQHLPGGDRGRAPPPPGHPGRGRLRRARRRVGRARPRRRPAAPGRAAHRRGRDGLRAPAPGRLQGAARGDLPRRLPAGCRGQAHQARAARALLGRPRDARSEHAPAARAAHRQDHGPHRRGADRRVRHLDHPHHPARGRPPRRAEQGGGAPAHGRAHRQHRGRHAPGAARHRPDADPGDAEDHAGRGADRLPAQRRRGLHRHGHAQAGREGGRPSEGRHGEHREDGARRRGRP